jgi:type IV pilus assembly protein PilP
MSTRRLKHVLALGSFAVAMLSILLVACGGDAPKDTGAPKPPGTAAPAAAPPPAAGGAADGGAPPSPTANMPPLPKRDFQERDFAESDGNRDPFRSFAADLMAQNKRTYLVQRKVLVDRYALEEVKLSGIITGAPSYALLIDPTGFGWHARVGDFVGKPEIVHSGGPSGADVPINWRLDRIRAGDCVFVREDPSHPEIAPTTRVIALRSVEEASTTKGAGVTMGDAKP